MPSSSATPSGNAVSYFARGFLGFTQFLKYEKSQTPLQQTENDSA
jgi:hypothetical protein